MYTHTHAHKERNASCGTCLTKAEDKQKMGASNRIWFWWRQSQYFRKLSMLHTKVECQTNVSCEFYCNLLMFRYFIATNECNHHDGVYMCVWVWGSMGTNVIEYNSMFDHRALELFEKNKVLFESHIHFIRWEHINDIVHVFPIFTLTKHKPLACWYELSDPGQSYATS